MLASFEQFFVDLPVAAGEAAEHDFNAVVRFEEVLGFVDGNLGRIFDRGFLGASNNGKMKEVIAKPLLVAV